jgi:hypothetical protein
VQLSRNISKELISHEMKKFKLLCDRGFENSKKNSTAIGSKKLVLCSGTVSSNGETMRKKMSSGNEVIF